MLWPRKERPKSNVVMLSKGSSRRIARIADLSAEAPASTLKSRSEVASADTWDLSPIFTDDAAWEEEFSELSGRYGDITAFKGTLGRCASDLAQVMEFEKSLDRSTERLGQYAGLRLSEDSSHASSLDRDGRLSSLCSKISEACSWVAPEIQEIPDATFESFLSDPALAEWRIPLERLRRLKPHILSNKEERILSLSMPAIGGHHETFSQLTNVDMTFGSVRDDRGKEIELTQSSFSSLLQRPDREVRRTAFEKFYAEFTAHRFSLASTLANSIKADVFLAKARNYPSALESSLFSDNVPVSVYDSLISAIRTRLPVLHRYYGLRQRVFNLPDLHVYDTYAPLVSAVQSDVSFDKAIEMVLASLAPLGSEYTETLERGLRTERWCDRYENRGKQSGAFSAPIYGAGAFMLMNYNDTMDAVFTLAHEAGHSMHTVLAFETQPYITAGYTIFVAEVASTMNERLMLKKLLESTSDPKERFVLVQHAVDNIVGTFYTQVLFANFELEAHRLAEQGQPITVDVLKDIYGRLLRDYYGEAIAADELYRYTWARIPHFYNTPYYVYQYATCFASSAQLYKAMNTGTAAERAAVTERYLNLLKSGGSDYPMALLKKAGVDLTQRATVQAVVDQMDELVSQLEAEAAKIQ